MGAKDTVMSEKQMVEVARQCWKTEHTYPDLVAQAQAEISFKAGIREVAGYIARNLEWANGEDEMLWQAQLKVWGIE